MKQLIARWKQLARSLKVEIYALYYVYRDPRVPWRVRLFAACVVGYALSPIDLIPDFIPVLGYLDDLVLVPLGIWLTLKMIPAPVLADCREKARASADEVRPVNRIAAAIIVAIWLVLAALLVAWVLRFVASR